MQKLPEDVLPEPVPPAIHGQRRRVRYQALRLASRKVLGVSVKLVLLAYFACAVLFLFLRYAVLPNIDYYKGSIEQLASRATGNQVSIARIYASWRGLRPNLFLGDVILRDRSGRQVLALPSVSATLSWWSVLAGAPRFESLEFGRPDLDVRRDASGRLFVAGLYIDAQQKGDGKGADWLLAQREIVVREGRVRWTDGLRGAPQLQLEQVNLVLRNQWRRHRLALHATPPAALAAPLDVRADFRHPSFAARISDVSRWKGQLYADLTGADLAAWQTWLDYPFALHTGRGALRAWLTLDQSRLAGFTADVSLNDLSATLAADTAALDLVRVRGRIAASEVLASGPADGKPTFGQRGHSISVSDFALETRDGLSLPSTTLSERHVAAHGAEPASTEVQGRVLDLHTLAEVAARLPLAPAQRALLEKLAPRGRLSDFSASWRGALAAPVSYRLQARVDGLGLQAQAGHPAQEPGASQPALAAAPALPGIDNLSGSITASEQGGSVQLAARDMALQMPAWFADPALPFEKLDLQARWAFQGKDDGRQLRIEIASLDFLQQGLHGSLQGSHLLPLGAGKGPGKADFTGTLDNFDVKTIGRYLPLQTHPRLRAWLTGALEDGLAQDVAVRLRGDLSQFPFQGGDTSRGEFRVAGKLEHGKLNYAPGQLAHDGKTPLWPQAENIHGSFVFERARMEIRGDTATTGGVALANVKAVIADLGGRDKLLEIDGTASGPMQGYLDYVLASPVDGWIGHFTEQTKASGSARLALKLRLPLEHLLDAKVDGVLQLLGNDVVLFEALPPVQGASGKIEFNETGVNLNGLAGSFVGGPVAISGGSQPDHSIQVKLGGAVTADGLRKTYPTPVMQRLAAHLSGSAQYSGLVTARAHQVQVQVDTTLAGVGLGFPAPFKKAEADSLPLRFVMNAAPVTDDGLARDQLDITVGNQLAASYQREKQGKAAWHVVRGGIGVSQPAPTPESGLMLNVSMPALDVDAWSDAIGAIAGTTGAAPASALAPAPAPVLGASHDGEIDFSEYLVPDMIAVRAGALLLGERKLQNVVLGATHQKGVWQANLDAAQASGYVTWNDTPSGLGKVSARLSSLTIPESDAADVKQLLETKSAAQSIPSLDIVVERFELFNKPLGRMELQAVNVLSGAGREWRVNKVALENPDGVLRGSGKWVLRDGRSDSSLKFELDIKDAGKLLDRFGFVDTIRRGKGKLSGDLAWSGVPYALDLPSLTGRLDMDVASGQFLKQDPGAAKLLGVLSLQALPRLLKLDFHDVFSEGLAFDGITANAAIMHGVAQTHNLKMHGVAATVLMDGSVDIANESSNLHVVVIPEFNLGTGPLVYALAVNPVIGIGSFLAQLFLRAPVMKALTYHMQISGPFKAPVVVKLDSDKLEAMAEPGQAPSQSPQAK